MTFRLHFSPLTIGLVSIGYRWVRPRFCPLASRYTHEMYPKEVASKNPSPLTVKQVIHNDQRSIVCLHLRQARKDASGGEAIIEALQSLLRKCAKRLVSSLHSQHSE